MSDTKNASQIRQQLKQVLFRHLQRILRNNFHKTPETCRYNHLQPVAGTGLTVGVCRWDQSSSKEELRKSPRGKLCDSRVLGCPVMASACAWWEPLRDKETIKAEFRALVTSGNRGKIASLYPDVAALMWVLDTTDDIGDTMTDVESEIDPPAQNIETPEAATEELVQQ